MRVLVVYGAQGADAEGPARAIGNGLSDKGHTVDVLPVGKPLDSLSRWEAVIIGGAPEAYRWRRDAHRFVKRHLEELRQLPVWFFCSDPPTTPVERLAALVGARGHQTFDALANASALPHTRAWGRQLGDELEGLPVRERVHVPVSMTTVHRLVLGLCLFTGVTAMGGGLALLTSPRAVGGPRVELLEHSPFESFLVPGLLLFLVVGLGNLAAAALEARHIKGSELAVLLAGGALTVWIVTQLVMIQTVSWLQLLYFFIGAITLGAAVWLWRVRHRLGPSRHQPPA